MKPPKNKNYCAVVVTPDRFETLPNCDNVKHALFFNNRVIVGKDCDEKTEGLFFPVETALSPAFLRKHNLYRNAELNADTTKKGFFEENGRVKAIKFRGHVSEGFFIPLSTGLPIGTEFDELDGELICQKYVPRRNSVPLTSGKKKKVKEVKIVDGQFALHYDTENIRRNYKMIHPNDFITISDKWHGTSAVFANVLVKRPLKWYHRLLRWARVPVEETTYAHIWASRNVVKGIDTPLEGKAHYYDMDIWGKVAQEVCPKLPKGFTVYGEIVGYAGEQPIQKGYTYGCAPREHHFVVYRVTYTNPDGEVVELHSTQLTDFCDAHELSQVITYFRGFADQIVPLTDDNQSNWNEHFLYKLEELYGTNHACPYNDGKVPAEGVVIRVDKRCECRAYKLKNWAFLEHETKMLDKGDVGIVDEEEEGGE